MRSGSSARSSSTNMQCRFALARPPQPRPIFREIAVAVTPRETAIVRLKVSCPILLILLATSKRARLSAIATS
ncbi:hypothetical protein GGQ99_005224 [Aminobacter niigataensis]|uniref:Uncharacterized protein n=1 Tax=Aminobacter niigataensis TaxID=83265 RepID=A0ABR6L9F1_9HYPH|nr:hypothetical protein [Aminobacter niigataensis]